ncbi:MAG: hypothetical protein H0V23_13920, partial [Nocardioidaceae bacterium]|nr:hypothetical protein [Nocardioidaceae bacterium]
MSRRSRCPSPCARSPRTCSPVRTSSPRRPDLFARRAAVSSPAAQGSDTVRRPSVVLGVGAGIAAYKVCELLRLLAESNHRVRVVPTRDSLRFVGAATWEALSGASVTTEVFDSVPDVPHVRLGQQADLVVVAPATADLLAKAA